MSNLSNFYEVSSPDHLKDLLSKNLQRVSLLSFWAPWAVPCKEMNEVVRELGKKYPDVLVLSIEADAQQDISESFDIEAVPSFILLRGHTLLSKISGADASALTAALALHAPKSPKPLSNSEKTPLINGVSDKAETEEELNRRLKGLMSKSKVVLFMKGSPDAPRCGFSRQTVQILREHGISFTHFDILTDEGVRQGLKKLNQWPTFPQLIVNGELVGGLDIIKEMIDSGEFKEVVG